MSKKNIKKNDKGSNNVDEPMNETMVKLILQAAGFSSPEEVRKIVEEENNKARGYVETKKNKIINADDWVGNWRKNVSPKRKPLIHFK